MWQLPNRSYLNVKRVIDLMACILLIVPLCILSIVIVVVLYMFDGGPAIYRQRRMGFQGKVFVIYKFRTMVLEQTTFDVEPYRTYNNDPRVTRIGMALRKYRLDELPQIINVLRGEMSWIGPRPEPEDLALHYEDILPRYELRYDVLPGVSGWAQVRQGHVTSDCEAATKLEYDLFYVKNISLSFDLRIAFETVQVVFLGRGSK